jgi:hypothetical protein
MWWLLLRPFFINCIPANIRTKLYLRAKSGCIETHRICRFDGNRHFQLRFRLRNSRQRVHESNALLALVNCCIAAQSNHHELLCRDGELLEEKKNAGTVKTDVLPSTSLSISHLASERKRNSKIYLVAKGLRPGSNIGGSIFLTRHCVKLELSFHPYL